MWTCVEGDVGFFLVAARPVYQNVFILFMFGLWTMIGSCWIGLVSFLGSPACFSGLHLGPRLIGLLEPYFPNPGLRVVFACQFACVFWLLLGPPFPFMIAVPEVLGALGLAC